MDDMNIHITWLTHVRTGPKKKMWPGEASPPIFYPRDFHTCSADRCVMTFGLPKMELLPTPYAITALHARLRIIHGHTDI